MVQYLIGDGSAAHFWLDLWLPIGRLVDRFGDTPIHCLELGAEVRVSSFIEGNEWKFPPSTASDLMTIFEMIRALPRPASDFPDGVIWKNFEDGTFSFSPITGSSMGIAAPWAEFAWLEGRIGKHSTCAWMAFHNALKTRVFLAARCLVHDVTCVLCSVGSEDCHHLFVDCPYSANIWREIRRKCRFIAAQHGTIIELVS